VGVNGTIRLVDYNIGYTYFKTDGISEAKDINKIGGFDKDGFKQNSFQANLGFQATKMLKVKPFLRYTDFDGKYDGGSFVDDTKANYTSSTINPGVTAQYQLQKGAVNFNYSYNKIKRTFESAYGKTPFDGRMGNAELFINYDIGSKVQLLSGVNLQNLKMMDTTATESNPSITITSPYLSVMLHNLQGFNFELGGRYNNHSKYGSNFTYSINPSYLITSSIIDLKTKLFFNYSTGFKAPTLYQLYGKYGANQALKPELNIPTTLAMLTSISKGIKVLNLKLAFIQHQNLISNYSMLL
jgi:vitamin B12 transporter